MAFSDKEIESFLNDDTGDVRLTSDADIEAFLNDKIDTLPVSKPSVSETLKEPLQKALPQLGEAADIALNPAAALLRRAPDLAKRSFNVITGRENAPAQTVMQAAANRPDVTATLASGLIPGAGLLPAAGRVAATAASAALVPENRTVKAATAGGLQTLFEALPYGAGKIAGPAKALFSKMSQTEAKGLQTLFDNPSLLFTGPNKAEAQAVYEAAATKAGLSKEVSDDVLYGARKKFLRTVTDAVKQGEKTSPQALHDARQVAYDLAEMARRKGSKNLARGWEQKRQILQQALAKQAPEIREADKVYAAYKTREPFTNLLPRNRAGDVSFSVPAILAGVMSGGPAAVMASPVVQGVVASGLGATSKAYKPAKVTLQTIRQYLQGR